MVGPYLVQRTRGDHMVWVTYLGNSHQQKILGKVREAKIVDQFRSMVNKSHPMIQSMANAKEKFRRKTIYIKCHNYLKALKSYSISLKERMKPGDDDHVIIS